MPEQIPIVNERLLNSAQLSYVARELANMHIDDFSTRIAHKNLDVSVLDQFRGRQDDLDQLQNGFQKLKDSAGGDRELQAHVDRFLAIIDRYVKEAGGGKWQAIIRSALDRVNRTL